MDWLPATPITGNKMKYYVLTFLVLCTMRPVLPFRTHRPHLCKICACPYDPLTWTVPTPGDEASYKPFVPDSEALLVNCSGVPVSPFAGTYSWPDVPKYESPEEVDPHPKMPIYPATRANFTSCQLSGAVKKFPTTESRKLRELSLAHNSFYWVDAGALTGFHSLILLDLSYNNLSSLPPNSLPTTSDAALASKLKDVRLSHNQFEIVPWGAMLRMPKLERLDLSYNFIQSLEGYSGPVSDLVFKNLTVLLLNHNQLSDFPTAVAARFPQLRVLDLSWNKMSKVTEALTTRPPSGVGSVVGALQHLKVLYLDGNQIKALGPSSFAGAPFLHFLSVSETKTLTNVAAEAFDGLLLLRTLRLRENVHLSHLPKQGFLQQVRQNKKWTIKEVDLSYNSLEQIPMDFLPWNEIKLIDLQGNPWNCNCSLQWMLDDLTPYVYTSNSSLLYDLRCAKPARLRGHRFVRWMGHSDGVFCGKTSPPLAPSHYEAAPLGSDAFATASLWYRRCVDYLSSGSYPSIYLAWVALPGPINIAPASRALGVIGAHKPFHHDKHMGTVEEDEVVRGMNTGMLVAIVVLGVALLAVSVAAIVLQGRVKRRERELKKRKPASQVPLMKESKLRGE